MTLTTSLIIPVYNEVQYLPLLLDSILHQTQTPNEIIICDNNSTDGSVNLIKSYQSRLPIQLLIQPQKGILPTVETAWRSSSGSLVLKVDADTILPTTWVEQVVNHFQTDPQLMALSGPWLASDGKTFDRVMTMIGGYLGSFALASLRGYPLLLGLNSAYRRDILTAVNGYHTIDSSRLDDQLITQKLHQNRYKFKWFADCQVYHSTRRYHHQPQEYLYSLMSLFHPGFYHEKTT